jgi:predicted Zn-ribbon and HTH transcriptional regulator
VCLTKWNTDGTNQYTTYWGGFQAFGGLWIDETGLYLCGLDTSSAPDHPTLVLTKWDTGGNEIWKENIESDITGEVTAIRGDSGSLYMCGYNDGAVFLIQADKSGNLIWRSTLRAASTTYGYDMWGSGSYIYVAGETYSFDINRYDMLVAVWDKEGNNLGFQTLVEEGDSSATGIYGVGGLIYTTGIGYNKEGFVRREIIASWSLILIPDAVILVGLIISACFSICVLIRTRRIISVAIRVYQANKGYSQRLSHKEVVYSQTLEAEASSARSADPIITCCRNCGYQLPETMKNAGYCVYCGSAIEKINEPRDCKKKD